MNHQFLKIWLESRHPFLNYPHSLYMTKNGDKDLPPKFSCLQINIVS